MHPRRPPPVSPRRLLPGETIGVFAPSSPQRDDDRLRSGIAYLRTQGYNVVEGDHLWDRNGYLAGTDAARARDLNSMLANPEVRMIVAARGGYGATRILPMIDYAALQRDPKIVVGFSDVTAITLAFLARANVVTFSGAMPGVDFWMSNGPDPFAESAFWQSVTSPLAAGRLRTADGGAFAPLYAGVAVGRLIAANLTLLCALIGTPYIPDLAGSILLIEEIGEEAYRVDRLLCQLSNAGILDKVGGIALGAFTGTEPTRVSVDSLPIEDVFQHYLNRAGVPAIGNVPYGHIAGKLTIPVGAMVELDGSAGQLVVVQSGVC